MSTNEGLVEEFLARVKERYDISDLIDILEMTIDEFVDLTWDDLLECHELQVECGIQEEENE